MVPAVDQVPAQYMVRVMAAVLDLVKELAVVAVAVPVKIRCISQAAVLGQAKVFLTGGVLVMA